MHSLGDESEAAAAAAVVSPSSHLGEYPSHRARAAGVPPGRRTSSAINVYSVVRKYVLSHKIAQRSLARPRTIPASVVSVSPGGQAGGPNRTLCVIVGRLLEATDRPDGRAPKERKKKTAEPRASGRWSQMLSVEARVDRLGGQGRRAL